MLTTIANYTRTNAQDAIDNFNAIAVDIMNNNINYDIKPHEFWSYKDNHGRVYCCIPYLNIAFIKDACGNITQFDADKNEVTYYD